MTGVPIIDRHAAPMTLFPCLLNIVLLRYSLCYTVQSE
jgi:hypothetical protein